MKIEVLFYEVKKVVSKQEKTRGQEYTIPEAQCVLHGDDGKRSVGVLNLPKDHPVVKPGFYTPMFELRAGFEGKLFAIVAALVPVKA